MTAGEPSRYVAFLRGINVGGHTVKMPRLRALFVAMGFDMVESFIASGNVIFRSATGDGATIEATIEAALHDALGYAVPTHVRNAAHVHAIAHYDAFPGHDWADTDSQYVVFLRDEPSASVRRAVRGLESELDRLHVHGRELYWLCRTRLTESPLQAGALAKVLGEPGTSRNMNTVRRLAAKYAAGG